MKTIDVVLFLTLGDTLMGSVIVHAIKTKYPESYIRFHTNIEYKTLLENNPEIDEIIAVPNNNYMNVYSWIAKSGRASDHIVKLAMANQFDTCWHHNPETYDMHMIDWYASRAGLDLKIEDYNVRIYPTTDDYITALSLTKDLGPYIIMHTTSLLESKNWPIQFFNHLASMLEDKYHLPIIQIGGPIDTKITKAISLLDKTSVKVSAALINNAKMYIGIDSGSAYIAGAAGIPTFLVMGATSGTDPNGSRVGPVGSNVHYIEPLARPDSPHCKPVCVTHCALNAPCINLVLPEQVFAVIENAVPSLTGLDIIKTKE